FNFLYGKEFINLGRAGNKTFAFNMRALYLGPRKYIPLRRNNNGELDIDWENYVFFDYSKAYEKGLDEIFQVNLSANYKIHRPKATHEISLDIINLTNSAARLEEYYDTGAPN